MPFFIHKKMKFGGAIEKRFQVSGFRCQRSENSSQMTNRHAQSVLGPDRTKHADLQFVHCPLLSVVWALTPDT
jgi:hypothetical protein